MKSKKVWAVLAAVLMALSLTACGGEGGEEKIKIGVMQFGEFSALMDAYEGFRDGLKEAGYEDGKNIAIHYLSAAADTANCPTIADSLINDGSDLIFAIATPSVSCIKEKTTTIPVLFTAVTDPVASGFFADAQKPGGNISGTSDMNPVKEQIQLLKEVVPGVEKIAVLYCSSESNSAIQYEMAKKEIEQMGKKCIQKTVSAVDEIKSAIESLRGLADAIYVPTDNMMSDSMALVSATADENGLPIMAGEPAMVENGATISYGINYYELGKQTAAMAVKVLQSNDRLSTIGSMPVEYQTKECVTAINEKSAAATGILITDEINDRATKY